MYPVTVLKADEPEAEQRVLKANLTEAVTGPTSVTALIKAAHRNASPIAALEAGYAGLKACADLFRVKASATPTPHRGGSL
jgi:hypothetical protein